MLASVVAWGIAKRAGEGTARSIGDEEVRVGDVNATEARTPGCCPETEKPCDICCVVIACCGFILWADALILIPILIPAPPDALNPPAGD